MSNKITYLTLGSFAVAILCSVLTLRMPNTSAVTSGEVEAQVTVANSCSMVNTINQEHTATIVNGHYEEGIGETLLQFFCNDLNGYAIYAVGFSGDTYGDNTMASSAGSAYNIPTDVVSSGDTSGWAMKISSVVGTYTLTIENSFNNYHTVPSTYTKIASFPAVTDTVEGSSITATYATYISPYQVAGTYTGKVKYTLLHPSTTIPKTINDLTYMQDFKDLNNGEKEVVKDSMVLNHQYILTDQRDDKEYYVAKLADGNIWMTENLDLDLSTEKTLTSNDTDLNLYGSMGYDSNNGYNCSNNSNNCENGIISWTPERSTILPNGLNYSTWQNDYNNPYSWQGNEGQCPNNPNASCNDGHSYANNYYNWSAAIASNNSSSYTTNNTVAANSICPVGWRLPNAASMTGGYEFSKLLYEYGVTNNNTNGTGYASGGFSRIINNPLWFVRSGNVNGGALYNLSDLGLYWSSAVGSSSDAYLLSFSSGNVRPASNFYRFLGFSVRCVAQ